MAVAIAMAVGGAILNAAAFTGSMELAKIFDRKHYDAEKIRHDRALEAYQREMGEWEKEQKRYSNWLDTEYSKKKNADQALSDSDDALALYAKAHPDFHPVKPVFSYNPSNIQKKYEIAFVTAGMAGGGYLLARFF